MSDLLEDRYRPVDEPDDHGGVIRARDELLEQDVDLVVLDPVAEPLERGRMLRQLRRTLRSADPHVALVQDTGTAGDRPFLVLPAETSPEVRWTMAFAPAAAARIVLDVLDAVTSMRAAGLSWLSLRQEDLRVDDGGRAQVVPLPGPADSTENDPEVLASLGLLLTDLLPELVDPLRTVAARATGLASPPLTSAAELRELLAVYAAAAPSARVPAPLAAVAPPTPGPVPVSPAPSPVPSKVKAVAMPSPAEPAPAPVEPAYAPKMISLSSLLAHDAPGEDYVPLASLLHDQDDGADDAPPPRQGHKGRGLFSRRSHDGDQLSSS